MIMTLHNCSIQVVVGSFIPGGKKESNQTTNHVEPDSTSGKLIGGGMTGASSPLPRGALSESPAALGAHSTRVSLNHTLEITCRAHFVSFEK